MRDVATGLNSIPNEVNSLEEIASAAQLWLEDTSDIDCIGDFISCFLHISASDSRTVSPAPGLKPSDERNDVLRVLKALGFDDENISISSSVGPILI